MVPPIASLGPIDKTVQTVQEDRHYLKSGPAVGMCPDIRASRRISTEGTSLFKRILRIFII
ncbi:hypothetical protein EN950_37685, partial [Mesorhizobium sp. M7A.F.Ca.US.007.01.1.1]